MMGKTMKNFKMKMSVLSLTIALPIFTSYAATDTSKEALQEQLTAIQARLAQLEKPNESATEQSDTSISFYGSLRPTFGLTSSDTQITGMWVMLYHVLVLRQSIN